MVERAELTALLREAHAALERTRKRVRTLEQTQRRAHAPLAIVGLACRYPGGADTPAALWSMLERGRSAVGPWPAGRGGASEGPPGAYLPALDRFDAAFFELDAEEARHMDPRQRLLLEVAWEAVERAGLTRPQLRAARVGIYVGASNGDYAEQRRELAPHFHSLVGAAASALSARLAYFLATQGPCLSVDTACASSLVAAHLASQALRAGHCELALVGGVNVILDPRGASYMDALGVISRTGRCRPFDAAADGFVRGEGCGVALLERLDDAQRLGHPILALLRGSAVNHNGRSSGIIAPRSAAQVELVRAALADAEVPAESVAFVETQGVGNPHGDAVEAEALAEAYASSTRAQADPLWLTASKGTLGHTESASGIAALIKTVMALQAGTLAPLSLETPSARIEWAHLRVAPARAGAELGPPPRRAGIHSYAITGVNAHLIVEAAPAVTPAVSVEARPTRSALSLPLLVSAPREAALAAQLEQLASFLERAPAPALVDLAHSLATTRTHHRWRFATCIAPSDNQALAQLLRARAAERSTPADAYALLDGPSQIALWLGPVQLSAAHKLAQLHAAHPQFRARLDEACALLDPRLLDTMLSAETADPRPLAEQRSFALSWALARCLGDWGLPADLVLARPGGELAAACVAGCLSLAQAAELLRATPELRVRMIHALEASTPTTPVLVARAQQLFGSEALSTAQLLGGEPLPQASARAHDAALASVGLHLDLHPNPDLHLHPDLRGTPSQLPRPSAAILTFVQRDATLSHSLMHSLTRAHELGVELDWDQLLTPLGGRRIELPTYAFTRDSYWLDARASASSGTPQARPVLTPETLEQLVREGFAEALRCAPAELEMDASSIAAGLDSLMAVQLRNTLETGTGLLLPATLLLELHTPQAVLDELHTRLAATDSREPPAQPPAQPPAPLVSPQTHYSSAAQRTLAAQAAWLPGAYQNLYAFEIEGPLRPSSIAAALRATATLELGLRTTLVAGRVTLRDAPDPEITARVDAPTALARAELEPFLQAAMHHVLELERAPVRWQLVRVSDEPHTQILLMWLHHIAFDGASMPRLMRTLQQQLVLHAIGLGDVPGPAPAALEFPAREAAYLSSAQAREDRHYWRTRCAELPPSPHADPRVPLLNAPHTCVGELADLERFARARGQTPNGLLLWAFGRALLEQLELPAVSVGVTVDLRPLYRTHDASPCAINVVPVPIARDSSPAEVLAASAASLRHARLPSSEIRAMLDAEPALAARPRFPMAVMFNSYVELLRAPASGLPPAGLPLQVRKLSTTHLPVIRPYVLSGFVSPQAGQLMFHGRYHPELFTPASMRELSDRLRAQLDLAAAT